MFNRAWVFQATAVGFIWLLAASGWSDEFAYRNQSAGQVGTAAAQSAAAGGSRLYRLPPATASVPVPGQVRPPAVATPPQPTAVAAGQPVRAGQTYPVPGEQPAYPPLIPGVPAAAQIRPIAPQFGSVSGRLTDHGAPVVDCLVAIVPMKKAGSRYVYNSQSRPFTMKTDHWGRYYVENVPAGFYKLTWLPQGTNQWIRRVSLRPDVKVKGNNTTNLKEIRIALHTVN